MFLTEQWRKLKTIPQTGGVVFHNSNSCHSFDPHLPADVVMLISQNRAMFHNCYALHFADLHLSHEHTLVATTADTYLPKPLNTRNPLWIWFIIYTSGGRFSTDPLWGHIQSCILGDGAAWSVLMSWLKFDSLRQQIWQLSAETSFSHTGIPLWGRA